jgi:hypothetical protein
LLEKRRKRLEELKPEADKQRAIAEAKKVENDIDMYIEEVN